MPNTQQPMELNVRMDQTQEVICEACGNNKFVEVIMMRKLSAIYSPTGKESFIPIPITFQCAKCGHINKDFMPPDSSTIATPETEE